MEYTCENTQHFVWGTRVRIAGPEGPVYFNVTHKEQGNFKMPEEGMPYEMDGIVVTDKPTEPVSKASPTDEERGPVEDPQEDSGADAGPSSNR